MLEESREVEPPLLVIERRRPQSSCEERLQLGGLLPHGLFLRLQTFQDFEQSHKLVVNPDNFVSVCVKDIPPITCWVYLGLTSKLLARRLRQKSENISAMLRIILLRA